MNIVNKILDILKGFLGKKKADDKVKKEVKDESTKENADKNADANAESIKPSLAKTKQAFVEKVDKYLHSNLDGISIFEKVNDARSLYLLEKTIHKNIIYVAFFFFGTTIICLLLILALFPLKEKEPYLVGFSDATQNFVNIERADSTITSNEALVRSLIGAYILQRESINHIDDKKRFKIVKEQSSSKVWNNFEAIVSQEKSIYTNKSLMREVEIINIAKWKDGYSNVDVVIRLLNIETGMRLESEKRYRIIIVYRFEKQKISFDNININPTGFKVIDYAITQIAVIKELDKNKQVTKDDIKSKIQDNKQSNQIDDYLNNEQSAIDITQQNSQYQFNGQVPQYQQPNSYQQNSNGSGNSNEPKTYKDINEFMQNNPNIFPQN